MWSRPRSVEERRCWRAYGRAASEGAAWKRLIPDSAEAGPPSTKAEEKPGRGAPAYLKHRRESHGGGGGRSLR